MVLSAELPPCTRREISFSIFLQREMTTEVMHESFIEKIDEVAEWAAKPTTWGFALITTIKGGIAVMTIVTMILSFADLHTDYKLQPPSDRCVPFFNKVVDAASSRNTDIVAYNYKDGMASVRVCTSDPTYWTSTLGSYSYDPFCYGVQNTCNISCDSPSIQCTEANSSSAASGSAVETCSELNIQSNNWIYGISVTSDPCVVEFVKITPPLPPCSPGNTVLSFEQTNTDVQTILQLLLIVPLFALLVQSVITINYTYNLSKAPEEGAKKGGCCCCCSCLTVQSMAYAMEGAPGPLLQFYYLVERMRGKSTRYIPEIRMTTCQLIFAVFQQMLEVSAPAIALGGCTFATIKGNRNLILNMVMCVLKGALVLHFLYAWKSSAPKPNEDVTGGSVQGSAELKQAFIASGDGVGQV
jgi:hypothetical protein